MFDPIVPNFTARNVTVRQEPKLAGLTAEQALDFAHRIRCTAFYLLTRNPMWLTVRRPTLRITED